MRTPGYLLHGPAGTGKTSLSLALAGRFGLELYLLHVPSVRGDNELERLFTTLPPRCFILLEDIDAVGIKNRGAYAEDDEDRHGVDDENDDDRSNFNARSSLTLSGLLNVLDGVASQEGRIVLMTSNFAERLDRALVRPGRIDRMIFLGNISPRSAELMFKRMFERDPSNPSVPVLEALDEEELEKLSLAFSGRVQDDTFTPAQLQGYLLNHRNDPRGAVESFDLWMKEEIATMEEAKKRASEEALARRRRKQKQLNLVLSSQMGLVGAGMSGTGLVGAQKQMNGIDTPPVTAKLPVCGNSEGSIEVVTDEESKEAQEQATDSDAQGGLNTT